MSATTVVSVTASQSGRLTVGESVSIRIAMSGAVTVIDGVPTLTLNDGGTAVYDPPATAALNDPTQLVFDYTVGATDSNQPYLAVVGGSPNGAIIFDAAGNVPDFTALFTTDSVLPGLNTDLLPPATVTGVTPSVTGTLDAGLSLALIVSFSDAVSFSGGTPTMLLNDGGTATYDAAATAALNDPTRVVFDYTVAATDSNVAELAIVGGSLNGATAVDANGYVPDFTGLYTGLPGVSVFTGAPATIAAITSSVGNGNVAVGETMTFTITMSKAVTISGGAPELLLNDGGRAVYDPTATAALDDPTRFVFDYTVGAQDKPVLQLAITGGTLGGATIRDANDGNLADLSNLTTLPFTAPSAGTGLFGLAGLSYNGYNSALGGASIIGLPINGNGSLIADAAGDLFGTTVDYGSNSIGGVYEMQKTQGGYLYPTFLASFSGPDGSYPVGGVIADASGDLFGTTSLGGSNNKGTVFEIRKTSAGYDTSPTTLISFNGLDGSSPDAGLFADSQGNLIGTTATGGLYGYGTVFEIQKTTSGFASEPTTLVSFNKQDGSHPLGALIADADGNLFSTTSYWNSGYGTVFEIAKTSTGYASSLTTLTTFDGANGDNPTGSLLLDTNGDLIGTTMLGGSNSDGTVFEIRHSVSGYDASPTTIVNFSGIDGRYPVANLITDADGNLYGTTSSIGVADGGAVFEIAKTTDGYANIPTLLASFNGSDGYGYGTDSGLYADPNGNLLGTNAYGWLAPEGLDAVFVGGTVFAVVGGGFAVNATQTSTSAATASSQPAGIDLSSVAFGADTTLAYAANSGNSGGALSVTDGTHAATIALIGQYAAVDFALSSDGHGGTLVSDPHLTGAALTTFLASPHS
ncbi:MAG: hypothetical protein P4M07_09215 [Xanthobacteraceae bacterium]|nr:hypothetical protein [Xanthobacteraceae bacterium]